MPFEHDAIRLDPLPSCAKVARDEVSGHLRTIARDDLLESAELAVSELVTNALLHAEPPVTVRVRGTRAHPRVEVADGSRTLPTQPHGADPLDDLDLLLATFGRGIRLVDMCSRTWGIDLHRHGKIVWFEPAAEPNGHFPSGGEVVDLENIDDEPEPTSRDEPLHTVRLLHAPVREVAHLRLHYDELRRELRLIAFQNGVSEEGGLPRSLLDYARRRPQHDLALQEAAELSIAASRGEAVRDLTLRMTRSTATELAGTVRMMSEADRFCRAQQLLTLAFSPRQLALASWMSAEYLSQTAGRAPMPWSGGVRTPWVEEE